MSLREQSDSPAAASALNEVSWQSAFWALVPIALNSMTQPCGEIFGLPSRYSFALRCSPIICAFDALAVACSFAYLMVVQKRSPRAASRRIVAYRFRDVANHSGTGSLEDLKNNTTFRLVLFVLGALPQIIKLYGVHGLLWTKVWATMFLASFVLLECLVLQLGQDRRGIDPGDEGDLAYILSFVVVCSSLVFAFYVFSRAVFAIAEKHFGTIRWPFALGAVLLTALYFVVMCVSRGQNNKRRGLQVAVGAGVAVPTTAMLSMMTAVYLPLTFGATVFIMLETQTLYVIAIVASVLSALAITLYTLYRVLEQLSPETARYLEFGIGTYFLLLHLCSTPLFYAFAYDPQGTVKPAWTEQLG